MPNDLGYTSSRRSMLFAKTGTGGGACGIGASNSMTDWRSSDPSWIEPVAFLVAYPPPNLETLQQACLPHNRELLVSLFTRRRWADVAELIATDAEHESCSLLTSKALAAFMLSASNDTIAQKNFPQAHSLLRHAHTCINGCTKHQTQYLGLVEKPIPRGRSKSAANTSSTCGQARPTRFFLSPMHHPREPATPSAPSSPSSHRHDHEPTVPLHDPSAKCLIAVQRPSMRAFCADMTAFYYFRQSKFSIALFW